MLRIVKIILIITVALYGFLGAFGNITGWAETLSSVGSVTSKMLFDGGATTWQAISNPVVNWIGALFIMLSKLFGAALCTMGAIKMWRHRGSDMITFQAAKEAALAGCGVMMIMLFGGFIVIAETWFDLWRSYDAGAMIVSAAFRYGTMITLIAVFVGLKEE